MSILSVNLVLSASRSDGGQVTGESFLAPLGLSSDHSRGWQCVADRSPGMSGLVIFLERSINDITGPEPYETLTLELETTFRDIAGWLTSLSPSVISGVNEEGIELSFIIEAWIDQDQIDIELPPCLMLALGSNGIPFYLISNE